jgi:hypothetical protein
MVMLPQLNLKFLAVMLSLALQKIFKSPQQYQKPRLLDDLREKAKLEPKKLVQP